MEQHRKSVGIVYNHVGEDIYEKMREVDPSSLSFTPEYKIDVATVQEEYQAIATALESEGFESRLINLEDNLEVLFDKLRKDPPDVVFNLVEGGIDGKGCVPGVQFGGDQRFGGLEFLIGEILHRNVIAVDEEGLTQIDGAKIEEPAEILDGLSGESGIFSQEAVDYGLIDKIYEFKRKEKE